MSRRVLLEEFHLSFLILADTAEAEVQRIRRQLNRTRFQALLRRTLLHFFRKYRALDSVVFKLSR
ncbi:hypothetical protein KIH39_08290 [Telmatocola sphagniphila]|uniref:Uncharacterized protein n=1 Tax=Telmatocola sphagniphila TaxID=1123043 RepID=A0A8E6BBK8_9BACT|nr:hypothetical protein [Telmatocola sphagniphila]QVL33890.1 hypothetical protein KIH39_08290 [Telmatocola sphagniphila]